MPITSCVGQQMLLFLTTATYLRLVKEFIFVLRTQTNLSRSALCNTAPNANLRPSAASICTWHPEYSIISCFTLYNSGSFSQRDKILVAGQASVVLGPMHSNGQNTDVTLTQLTVESDWLTFICSITEQYKHLQADYFMYLDFCNSVTTKINPTKHTNNIL